MPTNRLGHTDAQQAARLNRFKNTADATALATAFLGLYAGSMPVSDGTGGTEVSPATRPAITFGAVATDANGRHYITNSAAITGITLTNTAGAEVIGFGIFSANSGGTLVYSGVLPSPFRVAAGATISIPAGAIVVYAEPPTI